MTTAAAVAGRVCTTLLLLAMLLQAGPPPALAHGIPADLAFYGPFGRASVACLRILGMAAQSCFRTVLSAQRVCADGQLLGRGCDVVARDAQIEAAKLAARTVVDSCLGGQLTEIRMIGFAEARNDVERACSEADAVSALVYPAAAAGASLAPDTAACVLRASRGGRAYVRMTIRNKSRMLDRVAGHLVSPSLKLAQLDQVVQHMAAHGAKMAADIDAQCPSLVELQGKSMSDIIAALDRVADCVVGSTYVQTAVACPLAVPSTAVEPTRESLIDLPRPSSPKAIAQPERHP
jgi:hypothetical protein